jgi:hypothetical protein
MYVAKAKGKAPESTGRVPSDNPLDEYQEDTQEGGVNYDFLKVKSNVDEMDKATASYSEKAKKLITDFFITQSQSLIDREHMKEVASLQRDRFFACLSLPFSIMFFICFAMSVSLHEDISTTYFIETGLRNTFGAGLEEIESIQDTWNWLDNVLLDNVFIQTNINGEEEKDKKLWNRVLMYNQLTGPLVMEQLRSKRNLCFDGDGPFGDMVCYPASTVSKSALPISGVGQIPVPVNGEYSGGNITIDDRKKSWEVSFRSQDRRLREVPRLFVDEQGRRLSGSVARRLRAMRTEYETKLPGGEPPWSKANEYSAYFAPNTPKAIHKAHLKYLRDERWLDEQSKDLDVKMLLLNAEVGRPRLTQVTIRLAFSRRGGVFTKIKVESSFLTTWAKGGSSPLADFFFGVCLTFVTILEIRDILQAKRAKKLKHHLQQPWVILEGLIVVVGWSCLLGYLFIASYMTLVEEDLKRVVIEADLDRPAETTSFDLTQKLLVSTDNVIFVNSWFRLILAQYHLVLMFRFFSSFYAQPRLGVVTNTLMASIVDIIHFLIVLLPTFLAYAISGMFLFGRRMAEYSTIQASVGVCFKMAMEGEYDWPELSREHYWTAFLWVSTFMMLIVQLMLNMVLAIVMDIYTVRRQAAGNAETVGATLWNLYTRFRHSRVWVSNKELIEKSELCERLITRESMLKMFPGMCDDQLDPFMFAVWFQTELECSQSITLDDSMKMTMAVKLAIDKVNLDMHELQNGDRSSLRSDKDKVDQEWLNGLTDQMASHSHWMLKIQWHMQQLQWQWSGMEKLWGAEPSYKEWTGDKLAPISVKREVL